MVRDWPSSVDPNGRRRELRDLAQQVERDEGWGKLMVFVTFNKSWINHYLLLPWSL